MLIELQVRRLGKSLGVILPNEVVDRLQLKAGKPLSLIERPDGAYLLTQYDPVSENAEDIVDRYRNALRVLAK